MSSTKHQTAIYFSQFDVTDQVFYKTPLCYALVNIKPILPGHVLIVPHRVVARLTDLAADEVTDLFTTVQKVQRMLARHHFRSSTPGSVGGEGRVEDGSFNIAIQDGREAGQTVPHVHCHIIPRTRESTEGDELYERLQSEEGNVGGGHWDAARRPVQGGRFPRIEDAYRMPRSAVEMREEADFYRAQMELLD